MDKNKVLTWDEFFMSTAKIAAMRSKDSNTQVGACIVNKDKHIVGTGYNGMPEGTDDNIAPWQREGSFENTKYAYVVHAELNAILNSTENLKGCTIYVSLFPCNECAKAIVQSGIKEVVYEDDKYKGTPSHNVSLKILSNAGVILRKTKEINIKVN